MVLYECFRCGYIGKQKSHLLQHLNRKNVCKETEDDIEIEEIKKFYGFKNHSKVAPNCSKVAPNCSKLLHSVPKIAPNCSILLQNNSYKAICEYCLKTFSRNSNLTKHLKTCKKKKNAEMLAVTQNEKIIKMEKEIEELKNYKIQTQNNITNTNSHNITNNTININNYGDENLKHLRSKDFANLLDGIYGAVPKLIKKIHFDPNHPENQNIKLPNKKLPYLKVMKDNKWELVNKKPELLDLIDSKYFLLKERYYKILEKNKYNLTISQKQKIDNFIDKYQEEDKDIMLDLINKTELVLLNNIY